MWNDGRRTPDISFSEGRSNFPYQTFYPQGDCQHTNQGCIEDMAHKYHGNSSGIFSHTLKPACKVHDLSNENWSYKRGDLISGLMARISKIRTNQKNWPYLPKDLISVDHTSGLECIENTQWSKLGFPSQENQREFEFLPLSLLWFLFVAPTDDRRWAFFLSLTP